MAACSGAAVQSEGMNEPFRLKPVVVVLDVCRKGVAAVGDKMAVAVEMVGPVAHDAAVRGAKRLATGARWLTRPAPEMNHAFICARIKAARAR